MRGEPQIQAKEGCGLSCSQCCYKMAAAFFCCRRRHLAADTHSDRSALSSTPPGGATRRGSRDQGVANEALSLALRRVTEAEDRQEIRKLEADINALFEEYSELQSVSRIGTSLESEFSLLQNEFSKVSGWVEQSKQPTASELQAVRQRVNRVKRRFETARLRAGLHARTSLGPESRQVPLRQSGRRLSRGMTASMLETVFLETLTVGPAPGERVARSLRGRFPSPPPYLETDLAERPKLGGRGAGGRRASAPPGFIQLPPSLNLSYISLPPPIDETGAPPSYEDAVSTLV